MNPLDKAVINTMSEADWQNRLDDLSYYVLRQKGTEQAFTGLYTDTEVEGIYRCKGCHTPLFDSSAKFHSGCGWPSFDKVIGDNVVDETLDLSHGMRRIEVTAIIVVGIWVMFFQIIMSPIRGLDIVLIQQRLYLIKPKAILIYMLSKNF